MTLTNRTALMYKQVLGLCVALEHASYMYHINSVTVLEQLELQSCMQVYSLPMVHKRLLDLFDCNNQQIVQHHHFNCSLLADHVLTRNAINAIMNYMVYTSIHVAADMPLYPGAPISCRESWTSIYKFSVSCHLTDSSTQQLLDLIRSHCPYPNSCITSFHKLKKQVGSMECQYCSLCMSSVPLNNKTCSSCIDQNSQMVNLAF